MIERLATRGAEPPFGVSIVAHHAVALLVNLFAGEPFPTAQRHLLQARIDDRLRSGDLLPDDRRRFERASERANVDQPLLPAKQARKKTPELFCLPASPRSERRIMLALQPAIAVPLRFSVTDKVNLSSGIDRLH